MRTDFYKITAAETESTLKTDLRRGLSRSEAERRLNEYGYNEFAEKSHTTLLAKFLNQFKSFMILVLFAAAIVSGIVGVRNGEGMTDTIIIMAIVVVNAIIGVIQENKAEKSLDALRKMSAPHCKVVRDGELHVIASRELVVGDVVEIETGDSVPADLRLVESSNLKIEEAALTGESVPSEKTIATIEGDAGIGDRRNMAYSSCSVRYGHGRGVVVATGTGTEVGKIASMIESVPESKTPMQQRLDHLGKILAVAALAVCGVIFIIGMIYGHDLLEMFMTAVSLAVAAIPEGLPAVSTLVLAMGVQRLAKRNAIIRNMPSVETLGSTSVICSDKTGTLTQNRMTVVEVHTADGNAAERSGTLDCLVATAVMANDAKMSRTESGETVSVGDPTETALIDWGARFGIAKENIDLCWRRIAEIPFDSERKMMTTINRNDDHNGYRVAVKGGLDEVMACCNRYLSADGKTLPVDDAYRTKIAGINRMMAERALRVLAAAGKEIEELPSKIDSGNIERELVFFGLIGMIDPPREEVRDAVAECRRAGIRPVMITGDHRITAAAIAESLGIMTSGDAALTGSDVDRMDDRQLAGEVVRTAVFARVSPEHKLRIVKAFQSNGNIVAMTGDGVNDAPALKLADIGIAMGITGTDVSKEAADMVLADDNFATIVQSVSEGRRIYDNIIKSLQYMLSTNIGEILVLLIAVIGNWDAPLLPIHLLWINLVTDGLPAIALSVEPAEEGIMRRKPIDSRQKLMNGPFATRIGLQGFLIAMLSLAAYLVGMRTSLDAARTMTFATLVFSQMTMVYSIRAQHGSAFRGTFANGYLNAAVLGVTVLMAFVLFIPAVREIFRLTVLSEAQWWMVAALSVSALFICEAVKWIARKVRR